MANLELQIVTPEGVKLSASVSEFTAPSADGEFGVLPSHRPLLAALKTGIVRFTDDGEKVEVAVGPGFVEVLDDHVVLLTQKFIRKEDVDPVLADQAGQRPRGGQIGPAPHRHRRMHHEPGGARALPVRAGPGRHHHVVAAMGQADGEVTQLDGRAGEVVALRVDLQDVHVSPRAMAVTDGRHPAR